MTTNDPFAFGGHADLVLGLREVHNRIDALRAATDEALVAAKRAGTPHADLESKFDRLDSLEMEAFIAMMTTTATTLDGVLAQAEKIPSMRDWCNLPKAMEALKAGIRRIATGGE